MLKFDLSWLGIPPCYKMGTHAMCIFYPKTLSSSKVLLCNISESANQVTGAALCLQDFSMSSGRWMPRWRTASASQLCKLSKGHACHLSSLSWWRTHRHRPNSWEINGKAQGSEAEHTWKASHSTHKKWSMLVKNTSGASPLLEKIFYNREICLFNLMSYLW